jgi:hypothetical protein
MTIEEIFAEISRHMIKGIMTHASLADYYDFLGLRGYKRCHEYHYLSETAEHRGLCRYFINHHNRLIPKTEFDSVAIIPNSWYAVTRDKVDNKTRYNAVQNGFTVWKNWEKDTKEFYCKMYKELIAIDEVAAAMKVKDYIADVDCELKTVERKMLELQAIDYDMECIVTEQADIHDFYKQLTEDIGFCIGNT